MMKQMLCAVTISAALGACSHSDSEQSSSSASTSGASVSQARVEQVNDPIQSLTQPGQHCFSTAVEGAVGRLRASKAIDSENAEADRQHHETGALLPAGHPAIVTEVSGMCYTVTDSSLLLR